MAKARKRRKPVLASKDPKARNLTLRNLVAQITPENRYPEISIGAERGREIVEWVSEPGR